MWTTEGWIGEGGFRAPALEALIAKALGLWKYVVRGKPIPHAELTAVRQMIPSRTDNNGKPLHEYKRTLRQTIGKKALNGNLDLNGLNAGIMIMEVFFGKKDARTLSMVCELSQIMNFTLGGYNLKETTSLIIRGETWLEEMRGKNSEEDIARRRRAEELVDHLVYFLASTRGENYETVKKARQERAMNPLREELRRAFLEEPPLSEVLAKALREIGEPQPPSPEERIQECWGYLRRSGSPELDELAEIYRKTIPEYEKALRQLERRLEKRQLTEEEDEWKEETEKKFASVLKRADYLWSMFHHRCLTEVSDILSEKRKNDWIGGVS